jgi:flagellar hook-basal body complex protein FliE
MANSIQGIGTDAGRALGAQQSDRGGFRIPLRGQESGPSFADTLKQAMNQVSDLQDEAQDAISAYLRGEPVEVHQVMSAAEEAGIALEMLVEFRNKITEAYRTVISMQS